MGKLKTSASIYLKFGSQKIKIPVNPKEIEMKYPSNNKEYDVLGVGQIVVQKRPGLKEISWKGLFPGDRSAPYVNSGSRDPDTYVKKIEKAMKSRQKIRAIISRSDLYDTNLRCIVSDFATTDKGGEPGDIYYEITLQEYRDYAPKAVSIVTAQSDSSGGPGAQAEATASEERPVETPVLRVGASVIVNGEYCYDSTGSKPRKAANNISTTVTRIVSGASYPIHVGSYGWVRESQLQIMG